MTGKFVGDATGTGKDPTPESKWNEIRKNVFNGSDDDELLEALSVLMNRACNRPGGGGVRNVGEKVTMVLPQMEAIAIGPDGKSQIVIAGDYSITVERVS